MKTIEISELLGKTLKEVKQTSDDTIHFLTSEGETIVMYSEDGAPNDVDMHIESIVGELNDLIGSPLLKAEFASNVSNENAKTWTFIKLATIKGYVDIRYVGQSNGYYSEVPSVISLGFNE